MQLPVLESQAEVVWVQLPVLGALQVGAGQTLPEQAAGMQHCIERELQDREGSALEPEGHEEAVLVQVPPLASQGVLVFVQSSAQVHSFSPLVASHLPSPQLTQTRFCPVLTQSGGEAIAAAVRPVQHCPPSWILSPSLPQVGGGFGRQHSAERPPGHPIGSLEI